MNQEVMQLQTDLGNSLVSDLAEYDWAKIMVFYADAGNIAEAQCDYVDSNGQLRHLPMPDDATDILMSLKAASATPDHGTWLSVEVVIERSTNEIHVDFNYDDKPNWNIEPEPENYLIELEKYPRPAAEIPAWYPKAEDYPDWHKELER